MPHAWITALLTGLAASGSANAATRQPLGDHASVVFPQPPGKMKMINETPPGEPRATAFPAGEFKSAETWMARDGEATFNAMVMERPPEVPAPPACAHPPTGYSFKLTCRLIEQGGVAGMETRTESAEGVVSVRRMFSRPGETYMVSYTRFPQRAGASVAATRTPAQIDAEGQAFLDSLHVDPWNPADYPARPWPPLPVPPVQH